MITSKLNFVGSKAYSALLILLLLSSCARTIANKNELLEDKTNEIASVDLKEHSLLSAAEVKQQTYPEQLATRPKEQKRGRALKAIANAYKLNKIIKNNSELLTPKNKKAYVTNSPGLSFLKALLGFVLIILGFGSIIFGFYLAFLLLLLGQQAFLPMLFFLLLGIVALTLGIILFLKGIAELSR